MPDFAHPWFFLLCLPLLVGMIFRWLSKPAAIQVPSTSHYAPESNKKRFQKRHWTLLLEGLAGLLIITALAGPQKGVEIMPASKEGTDIMIALDFSSSMDYYDPEGSQSLDEVKQDIKHGILLDRLAIAKDQISRFIQKRSDDRLGLVIFGDTSYVVCPPTLDHTFILDQLEQLTNSTLTRNERSTNIAAGVAASINELLHHADKRRTIVLITDGKNTINDPVFTPRGAAKLAADKEITIHAVAIGGENPVSLQGTGRRKPGKFYTKEIEKIAEITNGDFFRSTDTVGFEAVMNRIDALETTSRIYPAVVYNRELFPYLTAAAGICLLFAFLLNRIFLLEIS